MRREWFRIAALAGAPGVVELHVFDEIGKSFFNDDAVTAAAVVAQLNALPENVTTIRVRVNSPGGDVFEALAITNAIAAQRARGRRVEARIEGLAASAATLITAACAPIQIAANALMMVHRPHSLSLGEADDHRKSAEALDKVEASIISTYRQTSSKSEEELAAMMKAETWMTADEAIEHGFATEMIDEPVEVEARFRPGAIQALGAIPVRIAAKVAPWVRVPAPEPDVAAAADVMRICADAGLDLGFANTLIAAKLTTTDVQARVITEQDVRRQAAVRSETITAMCAKASLPSLAAGYVAGAMPIDAVGNHLTLILALLDGAVEIDTSLGPDSGQPRRRGPKSSEVYANLNRPTTGV